MEIANSLRDSVADLLREGSVKFILPRYQNLADTDIHTKTSKTDFVTIADQEMEIFLTDRLPALLPDSWVLGEEAVSLNPEIRTKVSKGLVWCVDPVDGTRNFVQQNQNFCSMISLVKDNQPIASWIYLPLADLCYFTAIGTGCWHEIDAKWTQLPLHTTQRRHPDLIGTGTVLGLSDAQRDTVRVTLSGLKGRRSVGCAGVETVKLITAEHDFLFHTRITPWDHAPVALFTTEAGMFTRSTPAETTFKVDQSESLLVAPSQEMWHMLADYIWS